MDNPIKPKAPSVLDVVRCPASACQCPRKGGAMLCKIRREIGSSVVVEMVCPHAKGRLLEIPLGAAKPAKQLSELERITEGMGLLRALGCEGLHSFAGGLFIHVHISVLSDSLACEMRALGWEWHAAPSGFAFPLSPL